MRQLKKLKLERKKLKTRLATERAEGDDDRCSQTEARLQALKLEILEVYRRLDFNSLQYEFPRLRLELGQMKQRTERQLESVLNPELINHLFSFLDALNDVLKDDFDTAKHGRLEMFTRLPKHLVFGMRNLVWSDLTQRRNTTLSLQNMLLCKSTKALELSSKLHVALTREQTPWLLQLAEQVTLLSNGFDVLLAQLADRLEIHEAELDRVWTKNSDASAVYSRHVQSIALRRQLERRLSEIKTEERRCLLSIRDLERCADNLSSYCLLDLDASDSDTGVRASNSFIAALARLAEHERIFGTHIREVRIYPSCSSVQKNVEAALETVLQARIHVCSRAYEPLVLSTTRICKSFTSIESLSEPQVQKAKERAHEHAKSLLAIVDCLLMEEIRLRQETIYWKGTALDAETLEADAECSMRLYAIEKNLQTILALKEKYNVVRSQLTLSSLQHGAINQYLPHDQLLKQQQEWISAMTEEKSFIDLKSFISTIEQPLTRLTRLVQKFEKSFSIGTMSANPNALRGGLSLHREEARAALADLLVVRKEFRNAMTTGLSAERAQLELWSHRLTIAEHLNDLVLVFRTKQRVELCREVLSALESMRLPRPVACSLPAVFAEARDLIERVERKCGLVPCKSVENDSLEFVLTLFDRMLLLLETLATQPEAKTAS